MKYILLLVMVFILSSCAVGAATSGYSLRAKTAEELTQTGRDSLIDDIKEWVESNFVRK